MSLQVEQDSTQDAASRRTRMGAIRPIAPSNRPVGQTWRQTKRSPKRKSAATRIANAVNVAATMPSANVFSKAIEWNSACPLRGRAG